MAKAGAFKKAHRPHKVKTNAHNKKDLTIKVNHKGAKFGKHKARKA